jgi:ferric-dicitrate binding protein FerR (iron transport regulator)
MRKAAVLGRSRPGFGAMGRWNSMNEIERNAGNRSEMAGKKLAGWLLGLGALALVALSFSPALRADDAGPAARAVRLSSVDGKVQISQGNQVLADSAVANTPLFEGSQLTTADDGRAEIQFEDGSVARLSPNSSLTLKVLRGAGANGEAEIDLESGLAYFEIQSSGQTGVFRVGFGDSVATTSGFSVLRISLDTPPGELAVFSGNAHLERGGATVVDLHGGESVALSANDASHYTLNETIEPDSWDSWNSDRDQALTTEAANKTGASKNYDGGSNPAWNDLDANGNWYNVPGEGNIWSPYEAANAGWDPYGNGSWMNSPGYGYTWISGNSWGYLPYQCGLWNWYDSFGWGWAPGIGGCNPWWGGGFYRGPNIGFGFGGYRPPMRPRQPRRPFGGGGLIAVNRHTIGPGGPLPPRDKTSVVKIAGYTVQPMHAVSARPQYDHSASGFVNRTVVTNGGGTPAAGQPRGAGPGFKPGSTPTSGARSAAGAQRSYPSSPPPASHPSGGGGGGGGGGAAHGGGGGGAAHH